MQPGLFSRSFRPNRLQSWSRARPLGDAEGEQQHQVGEGQVAQDHVNRKEFVFSKPSAPPCSPGFLDLFARGRRPL